MIPLAYIQQWAEVAPWPDLRQVEQDLIISRALCDLFGNEPLQGKLAFRGGTAIHKLLFAKPLRYSEDIDLVQIHAEPIKETVKQIRQALSWLGKCSFKSAPHSVHLEFKFAPEADSASQLKVKIEINTREHEPLYAHRKYAFEIQNDWHLATAELISYEPEELFGTKLRALLQRNKNRDLFDLHQGLLQLGLDCDRVIACFAHYLAAEGNTISRANAEERMLRKLDQSLIEDIAPLLPPGVEFADEDAIEAFGRIWSELVGRISGEPWKSSLSVIRSIRESRIPKLLFGIVE